jgi:hypothetical protein
MGKPPAPGRRAQLVNQAGPAWIDPPAWIAVGFKLELGSTWRELFYRLHQRSYVWLLLV